MDIDKIINLRIRIADPHGYNTILAVDSLPDVTDEQTAYRLSASGKYVDYLNDPIKLIVADSVLWTLIDSYAEGAEYKAYAFMASQLGGQLRLSKLTSGTETTEYTSLLMLYNYYKDLADMAKVRVKEETGNSTGRIGSSVAPSIGGGSL